jgi:enediyne biosynthesis protein E4
MADPGERARRLIPGLAAVLLVASLLFVTQAQVQAVGGDAIAGQYKFQEMPIAFPAGYQNRPMKTIRTVNPAYQKIQAWISSVGASIAINDLLGTGRADGMCLVDVRTDQVVVTYTPTAPESDRFTPFLLDAAPLPMDDRMAPMGCAPGDFNGDGRMDLLVTYWGRTPVLFMARSDATTALSMSSYQPQELIPEVTADQQYHGPRWNTNAVNVADFDGDGHPDIYVGNYFPDSDVLDPNGQNNVQMNDSMSSARNAGGNHMLRWVGGTPGTAPTATYVEEREAVQFDASIGWTLAISSADLTGDGLPEVYVANDFGHDHLLYNSSTRGHIRFTGVTSERTATTPKSFIVGNDSFKGMGVDFGDLNQTGKFDMMVSNITVAWGLEESNFVFTNRSADTADMAQSMRAGIAKFTQDAESYGMAWTGWGWDVKMGDFLNSGNLEVLQTEGFVKGDTDRWAWLQELAMSNDMLLRNPSMWPNIKQGDDVAGDNPVAFYAKGADGKASNGKYVNVSQQLGLAVPIPTRGVATADTKTDGKLDFAVARQWGPPAFYCNLSPSQGDYVDLHLYRPSVDTATKQGLAGVGTPAYGATVTITTADGHTQVSQLDGGGGHGGKRSFEVRFGLGTHSGPVTARLQWRDLNGQPHEQTQRFTPGNHTLMLTSTAQEVPAR